jgi:hypothetical protein
LFGNTSDATIGVERIRTARAQVVFGRADLVDSVPAQHHTVEREAHEAGERGLPSVAMVVGL